MPSLYAQLVELRNKLEGHYHEVQDYEYTIEKGVLYCLQTRNGKMNAQAMVRSSVEMAKEGLITREKALLRIDPESLEQMMFPQLDPKQKWRRRHWGMGASPGASSGKIVFDADTAVKRGRGANENHSGARGNQAGRHPWLLRRRGYSDQSRRQDLPTRRSWRAAWASPAWSARKTSWSTCISAKPSSATRCCMRATWSPSTAAPAKSIWAPFPPSSRSSPRNCVPC